MRNFFGLLLLLFLPFSFAYPGEKDILHVVHNHYGNRFSLNGYDLQYEKGDEDFWIKTGDFLIIEDVQKIDLPGESFRYCVTIVSLEKKRRQTFHSRVMSEQKTAFIVGAKELSRTTRNPKWIPGTYHPEVCYQLVLEDGSEYTLSCFYSSYDSDEEAQAVLATMIVEPGDSVTFSKINGRHHANPYLYDYEAFIQHDDYSREYRLQGAIRKPSSPLKQPNTFQVQFAGTHEIYGIWPRSFHKVVFHNFLPEKILLVEHSDLSMEEIAKKGELQFVKMDSRSMTYVFKPKGNSSKEVRLRIWESPGF